MTICCDSFHRQDRIFKNKIMNGFVPEADGDVAQADTIAHAQTFMVHKQPPRSLSI